MSAIARLLNVGLTFVKKIWKIYRNTSTVDDGSESPNAHGSFYSRVAYQ